MSSSVSDLVLQELSRMDRDHDQFEGARKQSDLTVLGKEVAPDSARNAARIAALNALAVAVAHHD
jgi:hypothetical protein